jgi:hypothetical protein
MDEGLDFEATRKGPGIAPGPFLVLAHGLLSMLPAAGNLLQRENGIHRENAVTDYSAFQSAAACFSPLFSYWTASLAA